ncbi:MAG TPA: H-NS family nucleoid-associated regulatory protein, partial [Ramlibacter sp.]|nr:H-NS family nucleoid-associated regulatory protein [Ramlibacter sp.]
MATYIELRQQAEKLMAEAEELRQKEIGQAIEDIKAKMTMYGLTAKDLGLASGVAKAPARKVPASSGN